MTPAIRIPLLIERSNHQMLEICMGYHLLIAAQKGRAVRVDESFHRSTGHWLQENTELPCFLRIHLLDILLRKPSNTPLATQCKPIMSCNFVTRVHHNKMKYKHNEMKTHCTTKGQNTSNKRMVSHVRHSTAQRS